MKEIIKAAKQVKSATINRIYQHRLTSHTGTISAFRGSNTLAINKAKDKQLKVELKN